MHELTAKGMGSLGNNDRASLKGLDPRQALARLGSSVFFVALAIYPLMSLWGYLDPRPVGPTHLHILIPTCLLVAAGMLQLRRIVEKLAPVGILIMSLGVCVVGVQVMLGVATRNSFPLIRVLYTVPFFAALYSVNVNDQARRKMLLRILIWNSLFVATAGILQSLFFPTGGREAAFLGGANVFANFTVMGLLATSLMGNGMLPLLVACVLFFAVTLTASRWAFVAAAVVLAGLIMRRQKNRWARVLLFSCLALAAISMPTARGPVEYVATRALTYSWLEENRWDKNAVGVELMLTSPEQFLAGRLSWDEAPATRNEVEVSDNSFVLLALYFGVPLATLWITLVLPRAVRLRFCGRSALVLCYVIGTLVLNNALLWDIWVLYVLGVVACARHTLPVRMSPMPSPEAMQDV